MLDTLLHALSVDFLEAFFCLSARSLCPDDFRLFDRCHAAF